MSTLLSTIQNDRDNMASSSINFDDLYKEHATTLLNIALRKLADKEVAMDVVQDLFVDLWQRKSMITISGNVQHYLVSALYHKIFQHFRKVGVSQKHLDHFLLLQAVDQDASNWEGDISLEANHELVIQHIDESVAQMPPRMRTIFQLKYYKSYSNQEIASMLGISNQTVKNQLSRSLDQVRKELSEKRIGDTVIPLFILSQVLLQ